MTPFCDSGSASSASSSEGNTMPTEDEFAETFRKIGPLLTDTEVAQIEAVSDAPNDIALSRILHWAEDTRIAAGLLENVLDGKMRVNWDFDDEDIEFQMTEMGVMDAEAIIKRATGG